MTFRNYLKITSHSPKSFHEILLTLFLFFIPFLGVTACSPNPSPPDFSAKNVSIEAAQSYSFPLLTEAKKIFISIRDPETQTRLEYSLEKTLSHWIVVNPIPEWEGDDREVRSDWIDWLQETGTTFRFQKEDPPSGNLARLGFSPPWFILEITGNGRPFRLEGGLRDPERSRLLVRFQKKIYYGEGALTETLSSAKNRNQIRETRIFPDRALTGRPPINITTLSPRTLKPDQKNWEAITHLRISKFLSISEIPDSKKLKAILEVENRETLQIYQSRFGGRERILAYSKNRKSWFELYNQALGHIERAWKSASKE